MFGKWIGNAARKNAITPEILVRFSGCADLTATELKVAAEMAERVTLKPGLVWNDFPHEQLLFLESGSLQIQTRSEAVVRLEADTPAARYRVPVRPEVVSLYATEPVQLLCVPESVTERSTLIPEFALPRPEMNSEESVALKALRQHFRETRSDLPSLPDLALKIGRAVDDPGNANEDIARLIQLDPPLAARILAVVNSAAFGGVSKIKSIQLATSRLGRNKVRSLVYSCLLRNTFKSRSSLLKRRMRELWQHSTHVAALSYVLARETPGVDPEQALLAGLIHDIGAVAVIAGISNFPILAERKPLLDYSIDSLRVEVGMQILKRWGLAEELEVVVRNAENWMWPGCAIPSSEDVVILAQLHAMIGSARQLHLPRIDTVPAFAKLAQGELSPKLSLSILEEADADVREIHALISGG